MPTSFVHLHCHTEYSISDGLLRIKPFISQVKNLGMPAVAITDFHNLFAAVRFYKTAIQSRVKPILGCEIFLERTSQVTSPPSVVLLCQNDQGYRNLTELISEAYLQNHDGEHPFVKRERLLSHSEGLIVLSGGIQGDIGHALLAGQESLATTQLQEWQSVFGDRFYLELTRTGRPQEEVYIARALNLASEHQCPVVATNDVRFLAPEDYEAHEARICIHQGLTLDDPKRPRTYSARQYLASPEEMQRWFADIPEALANTVAIAQRCNLKLTLNKILLPNFPTPNQTKEADYLRELSREGLNQRLAFLFRDRMDQLPAAREAYEQRLALELDVIISMGFSGYFLIVADFIRWAKEHGIPVGPGRGSGAGSLVAYSLLITDLDPLEYELLFERFLNPERVSMPDFDIDFCMEGRDRVIDYVASRYGRDSVSQIITFGTMAAKAVVRDVGRVLGHPYGFVDQIAKLIPFELGITLEAALEKEEELRNRYNSEEDVKGLIDLARKLEGLTRNAGKHAGGVVIAPSKLTDYVPLYRESKGEHILTQFHKDDVEEIGLVKFDFLGLRTLTIIDWALKAIEKAEIASIPLNDPKTYELLKACQTTAVFQLESRGMKDLIKRLQPDCFEEIIALVALFRPGPLQSGMVDDFIDRKHGRAPVIYPHPDLEPILRPTYGVILYQEQVMQITQVLAGYTLGGADILRRAMGKKKPEEMAKQRTIFIAGSVQRGVEEEVASQIFDLMEKFAGYGFNKSHSAAYALVAYQTAWLKAHYPAAYMAAVLSSDMDKTEKVVSNLEECRAMNLTVLPPHVNHSDVKFAVNADQQIRYGLGAIKGVGEAALESIIQSREEKGPFLNLFDLCQRADCRKVNRRILEALIRSGAMDGLGPDRATQFISIEAALGTALQASKNKARGQRDLFEENEINTHPDFIVADPWSMQQQLNGEKETLGFYLSGHPVTSYEAEFSQFTQGSIQSLFPQRDKNITVAGLVTDVRKIVTKLGRRMAILTLEDATGQISVTVFSNLYDEKKLLVSIGRILIVEGVVSHDDFSGGLRITAEDLHDVDAARARYAKAIQLNIEESALTSEILSALQAVLAEHKPGPCRIKIHYEQSVAKADIVLGEEWRVRPSDAILAELSSVIGKDRVSILYR